MQSRMKTKRMAEGGEAKGRSPFDLGMGAFGGLIPVIASGELGKALGGDRGELSNDETKKLRAIIEAQGGNPGAIGMKRGGPVKKMASGGAAKRGDGCAVRGKTKGRMM